MGEKGHLIFGGECVRTPRTPSDTPLVLHCYCGDSVKYGLLSKHLFQRKRQLDG